MCNRITRGIHTVITHWQNPLLHTHSRKNFLISCCSMFAFWSSSQRDWEVEVSRSAIGRDRLAALGSAAPGKGEVRCGNFWCAPVSAGPNSVWKRDISRSSVPSTRCETLSLDAKREVSQWRRYPQRFVFVLGQDLVVGFQSVPAKKKKKTSSSHQTQQFYFKALSYSGILV